MKLTNQDASNILAAFPKWIAQRAGLDFANYGDMTAFRGDSNRISKDRKRAKLALAEAMRYEPNGEAMERALSAYSGRLEWKDGAFEYTTGQYFPTECAAAAAAVLESYIDLMRPKQLPAPNAEFSSLADIKAANYASGGHWFDKSSMRFFRSRILPRVYKGKGGIFFVSSEEGPHSDRRFNVRQFDPANASIGTFGEFNVYSRERAIALAKSAAKGEQVNSNG